MAGGGTTSLVEAMDAAGYRLTEPRRVVAELISAREGHFAAADLIEDARMRSLGIGRATIFRVLDLLTELEVLEPDRPPLRRARLRALPPSSPPPPHHLRTLRSRGGTCGDQGTSSRRVDDIERRNGWRIGSHRLELDGRCRIAATSGVAAPAPGLTAMVGAIATWAPNWR